MASKQNGDMETGLQYENGRAGRQPVHEAASRASAVLGNGKA